jgi:hypothetical protein
MGLEFTGVDDKNLSLLQSYLAEHALNAIAA